MVRSWRCEGNCLVKIEPWNNGDTLVIWDKIANYLDMCLKVVDLLPNYDSTRWKWWFAGEWNGVPVSHKPIVPDFEGREIPLVKLLYKDVLILSQSFPRCFPCFFAQIWFMDIYGNAFIRSYGSTDPQAWGWTPRPGRACGPAFLGCALRAVLWRCWDGGSPGVPWLVLSALRALHRDAGGETLPGWQPGDLGVGTLGLNYLTGLFLRGLARFWIESSVRVDLGKLVVQQFNMFDMRVWEWLNVNFTCNGPILHSCGFFLTVVALMSCDSHPHTHTHSAEKSFCTIMMLIWVSFSLPLSLSHLNQSLLFNLIMIFAIIHHILVLDTRSSLSINHHIQPCSTILQDHKIWNITMAILNHV